MTKRSKKDEFKIVRREEWGAQPPREDLPAPSTPVDYVVTYPETDTAVCYTKKECIQTMQEIQKKHMDKGEPDIPYSFLVGLDGRVYEGRGWNTRAGSILRHSELNGNVITIAYIGNFEDWIPPYRMTDATEKLIENGVQNNYIKKEQRMGNINWDTDELQFKDDCKNKKPFSRWKVETINIPKVAKEVLTREVDEIWW